MVNIPGEDLSQKVWGAVETLATSPDGVPADWSLIPAGKVAPALVRECRAHLECVLDSSHRFNTEEIALFGRIVAVSVDEAVLQGDADERYRRLSVLQAVVQDEAETLGKRELHGQRQRWTGTHENSIGALVHPLKGEVGIEHHETLP